ncbi:unnamed protein product [Moneuplotes crassus]|uniref:EF-hand domain-containing protein n=1 Tax=Euplotes crassus TaxID=5936 RepID=A0AAD1XA64_EUPCR|nr:unnamed protein product [Moneuplotes crassus]
MHLDSLRNRKPAKDKTVGRPRIVQKGAVRLLTKSKSPPSGFERKVYTPNLLVTAKSSRLRSGDQRIQSLSKSSSNKEYQKSTSGKSGKQKSQIRSQYIYHCQGRSTTIDENDEQIESLRQFNLCFHEVVKKNDTTNCGILNYKKAVSVLTDLGFMRLSYEKEILTRERQLLFDIWRICKGNQNNGINIRNFKLFLLAIMKFNFSWMKTAFYNNQEISLSLNNGNGIRSELKNLSECQNNQTLDNLSSIKQDFSPALLNLKVGDESLNRPLTPCFQLPKKNCNPSLQKFLNPGATTSEILYQGKRQLTLDMFTIESEQFRSQTPKNDSVYKSVLGTEILGQIGTFDQAGDFYFKNDFELQKVQNYFQLFYVNRVNFCRSTKHIKLSAGRKSSAKRAEENPRTGGGYISYHKYLSNSSKHKCTTRKPSYKYLGEESAESCEALPSTTEFTRNRNYQNYLNSGFKFCA